MPSVLDRLRHHDVRFLRDEHRSCHAREFASYVVVRDSDVVLGLLLLAIVLSDLASTMYYIGGITEQAIGKPAAWMVVAVMLFSYLVRSVYMESCSMFVRGGVYVVVKDSIGPTVAKLSVSSLVVDYILTGPISSVSAGQYLGRLLNELSEALGQQWRADPNTFAVVFSIAVTVYFCWINIKGVPIHQRESMKICPICPPGTRARGWA